MADLTQDDGAECPLCMEPLEVDDLTFFPCSCGYQICRFCWHRIRTDENELCPACRKAYSENPADFKPLSQEQVAALKAEKRARDQQKKQKVNEDRKHLANVRVVQKNLVFVVGLPPRLADPEVLKRHEYFGKYGKIHKVVINPSTAYAGAQGPSASAYVTYVNNNDALKAIQSVNNITIDGRLIKTSLGTTKYCSNFMKNQPCPKPDCMYLHDLGDEEASFTKEEMHQGKHQEYEKKLHDTLIAQPVQEESVVVTTAATTTASATATTTASTPPLITSTATTTTITTSTTPPVTVNAVPAAGATTQVTNGKAENRSSSTETSKRERREKEREKRENSSNGGTTNGNGGHSKRNKDTWPSLTTSPTPKTTHKSVKENGKVESKTKNEKHRSEREKKSSPTQSTTPPAVTTIVEEKEPAPSESSNDSGYQKEKDDILLHTPSLPETTSEMDVKTNQIESFFETSDSSNSADTPFTNLTSEQQAKGRINSQLPDLLTGTEIDRTGYFGSMGVNFSSVQSAFAKHDGFADWDDKLMFQPFNKMKLEEAMQRDESKNIFDGDFDGHRNIELLTTAASMMDKTFGDHKMDAKTNCSSNMMKFFDFHKNLQNQQYYHQHKSGYPMGQEKSYSIFSDYTKPSDVETKQRMAAPPPGNFPHPEQQQQQQHYQNNANKHNSNILNSMYQMSSQPTVADELGFDPFTETQKALEELIKDEVSRKKAENGEMAAKRNALNAPPGFSQLNNSPSPRNLLAKQAGWNNFSNQQQQQHQNHNMMGMNKGTGLGSTNDWTTYDPAIVSFRQFPSQHNNYGSNGMEHLDPRGTMGMPNVGPPNPNDFHFNIQQQQQQQHQQPNMNFHFDSNASYGLFASHARNSMVNSNANNWYNHPSPGYQNTTSNLEKLLISMPPGFPANGMNGNRNN